MLRKAYVLVECSPGRALEVASVIRQEPGVTAADVVTGPMDVITTVEGSDTEAVAKTVLMGISGIPGVHRTTTCAVLTTDQSIPTNAE